ncbi:hypothetical protein PD5205_04125 (plasmid) [Xanthomonas fragariae]|uniref:Uncharacterized protein n=1 Tax=Xanthomonas fragariae TaxID=48664 RepID=A0A1Y6HD98_9XANT|nr:hypothetical protein PD885_04136 [Xanthomonas fragariae]SMR06066.1 hypothetical protein PD5205_04125 [Xanthomonas fragariae]
MDPRQQEREEEATRLQDAQLAQLREQRDELAASQRQREAVRIVQATVQRDAHGNHASFWCRTAKIVTMFSLMRYRAT